MLKKITKLNLLILCLFMLTGCDLISTQSNRTTTVNMSTTVEDTTFETVETTQQVTTEATTIETTTIETTTTEATTTEIVTTEPQTTTITTTQPEPVNYTVSFNTLEGSTIDSIIIESGELLASPNDPILEGHTFSGWYTDEDCLNAYDFSNPVSTNLTLYAKWTINQYQVSFINYDETVIYSESFNYGADISTIPVPQDVIREGYLFMGWQEIDLDTMPAYNIVCYPNFLSSLVITNLQGNNLLWTNFRVNTHEDYVILQDYSYSSEDGEIYLYSAIDGSYLRTIAYHGLEEEIGYGHKLLFSGDYIIVPTYSSDIYIYKFSDETYMRTITATNGNFEENIAVDGDYLVVAGEKTQTFNGLYVYKLSDDIYERQITSDEYVKHLGNDWDTYLIVKNGYIIVSDDWGGPDSTGRVHVFKIDDPTYERILIGSHSDTADQFGNKIKLEENNLLVVTTENINYSTGEVYIYSLEDESFERYIEGSDIVDNDIYAYKVYISGDYICVTAELEDSVSALYIYKFSEPTYERIITLFVNTCSIVGYKLSIYDDYIIASKDYMRETDDAVYIYKLSDETYERVIEYDPNDQYTGVTSEAFVIDNYIYITNPAYDNNTGAIFIYNVTDDSYLEMIQSDQPAEGEKFSYRTILIGDALYIEIEYVNQRVLIYEVE